MILPEKTLKLAKIYHHTIKYANVNLWIPPNTKFLVWG